MIVTFSSSNSANIMMFGGIAKHLLTMMGHSASIPGAILADDVAVSLQRLEGALAADTDAPSSQNNEDEDGTVETSLKKRALPLIDLLKLAMQNNSDVMWK